MSTPRLAAFQSSVSQLVFFDDALHAREFFPLPLPGGCTAQRMEAAPRGERLALEVECASGPQVLRWDAQRRAPHDVTADWAQDAHLLGWSADGQAVYLRVNSLSDPRLVRWEWDGKIQALPLPPFTYHVDEAPDGRLLFAWTQGVGFGSELVVLTGGETALLRREVGFVFAFARWSPQGERIAFIRFPDSTVPFPSGELVVMQEPTWEAQVLSDADAAQGLAPLWSLDGTRMLFARRVAGSDETPPFTNLWAVEVQSAHLWPLTHFQDVHLLSFQLSPGGERIALAIERAGRQQAGLVDWEGDDFLFLEVEDACCVTWVR
ncbi:MAG: TolB family protein [Anaerolineales bacterium]